MNKIELFLQKEIQNPKNWLIKEFYERKNFSNEELLYLFSNNKLKRNGLPMKKGGSKKKREKRKIIRSQFTFNIIEDIIDDTLFNKYKENSPFFGQFVEIKNINIGDTNEFYCIDDSASFENKSSKQRYENINRPNNWKEIVYKYER